MIREIFGNVTGDVSRRIRQCKSRVGGVSRTGGSKGLAVCQVVWNVAKFFFNPFTRSHFRFFLSLSTFWNFPHLLKAKRTHENSHERSLSTWRKFLNLLKSTVRSRPFEIFRLDPHSGTPWIVPTLCKAWHPVLVDFAQIWREGSQQV